MKKKLKLHLIINPNAGNGSGSRAAKKITATLTAKDIPFQTYETNYPNHGQELATALLRTTLKPWTAGTSDTDNFPLLVVLGGDGTLHEVINALGLHPNIPVGYIPCGSGNDFARGVAINRTPLLALEQLLTASQPQFINTLVYQDNETQDMSFLTNNLGIGIDANIVATANKSHAKKILNKIKLGSLSYLFAATKVLIKQKGFALDIKTPSEERHFNNAYLCTVTNHPYFGGGVALAPFADAKEADMTLMIVERIPLHKLLKLVHQLMRKTHLDSPYLHQYQSSILQVVCHSKQFGQSDGEELGLTTHNISFSTQKRLFWF